MKKQKAVLRLAQQRHSRRQTAALLAFGQGIILDYLTRSGASDLRHQGISN